MNEFFFTPFAAVFRLIPNFIDYVILLEFAPIFHLLSEVGRFSKEPSPQSL